MGMDYGIEKMGFLFPSAITSLLFYYSTISKIINACDVCLNGVGTVGSKHHTTQKTVAIVVGGVAAMGFLVVCLMFVKSLMKKKRGAKYGDYY